MATDFVLEAPTTDAPARTRRFLFVTAPFGPFSRRLARRLRREGAHCARVILNGGDLCEWGVVDAHPYFGGQGDWPAWVEDLLIRERITDVILHGESHNYGRSAIQAARRLGVQVHVFEQGYFRPHWITLEREGVNANSNLPRSAAQYRGVSISGGSAPPTPVGRITPAAIGWIIAYHLAAWLFRPAFGRFENPYAYSPVRQAISHVRRFWRQRLARRAASAALSDFVGRPGPIFLVLLQRPGDSQLTRNSEFESSSQFIDHVVASFAQHAEPGARLMFKSHPLDHGIERHDRSVADAARRHGVGQRVLFVDHGHFPTLIARACGVITVNSTGGLSAIEAGLPTIVLGRALYDIEGLTHRSDLAAFWRSAEAPDRELYERFRAVVMASCQINGAFSTRHGMKLALGEASRRLIG